MTEENEPQSSAALLDRIAVLESELARRALGSHLFETLDAMFEGVQIIDRNFRYLYINKTAANHGHSTPEKLIGQSMAAAYPGIEETEMFRQLESCMDTRRPQQLVNRFEYPDGGIGWFDLRFDPVPNGVLILSIDISEVKNAQEALRQSNEKLGATLESMAEAVITTDAFGCVTDMNPSAESLTLWSKSEALGQKLQEIVPLLSHHTGKAIQHTVERVLEQGVKIGLANDTLLVNRKGEEIPVATSGAPLRTRDAQARGVVIVIRDMREEYRLSAMLQQSQKLDAIGRLASGVAHDFNNLLTVINGYSNLALMGVPPKSKLHHQIKEIAEAGDRAAKLTQQLLTFSRAQTYAPQRINLNEELVRMESILRRLLGEDVDLSLDCEDDLPSVLLDSSHADQILMNLAVNARHAMPGGGRLYVRTRKTYLDTAFTRRSKQLVEGEYVQLSVSDNGVGMSVDTLARVFEPFFSTKGDQGTGLGLATVFGIVQQGKGEILVESKVNAGTTFDIYLPVADRRPNLNQGDSSALDFQPGNERIVVVIEDDVAVRDLLRTFLEDAGYTVIACADADQARQRLFPRETHADLLLVDVVLPRIGGRELADELLASRPELKVLFISGYSTDAIEQRGGLGEQANFIQKPISREELLDAVQSLIGSKKD